MERAVMEIFSHGGIKPSAEVVDLASRRQSKK
jgi:hypothetical protein